MKPFAFGLFWFVYMSTLTGCHSGNTGDGSTPDAGGGDSAIDAGSDGGGAGTGEEPPALGDGPWFLCEEDGSPPTGSTVITAFDRVDQYHGGEPNRRTVDIPVDFPEDGLWQRIDMVIRLECPADGFCDAWDRFANVSLVENAAGEETALELARYVTPYGVGLCLHLDATRFGAVLKGRKTLRSFVDTWVNPKESLYGHGWRVSVAFVFHPGPGDESLPSSLVNLWPLADIGVGDPERPVSSQIAAGSIPVPSAFSRAELIVTTTGHGQGNADNCAEFCPLSQIVLVDGVEYTYLPWRYDCEENPSGPGQFGSWEYPRSGWCPGAYVVPQIFDITSSLSAGRPATVAYEVRMTGEEALYENSCRPGAGDGAEPARCDGCVFDAEPGNCDYNSGNHTPPIERLSAHVVFYDGKDQ